jgi:hypothetical protein
MPRATSLYLVERYWPGVTLQQVRQAAARTVRALEAGSSPASVRYLGSTLIADEETVLSLFDGPDLTAVEEANRRGQFRYDRIRSVAAHCP